MDNNEKREEGLFNYLIIILKLYISNIHLKKLRMYMKLT